jgi:ABC-type Fe3+-hydroxamate transport system substrate-binding protein
VGGTKQFDFNVIDELQPDLIIGNKEENYQEGIETLQRSYPVWMSDIFDLTDALDMIAQVGAICNRSTEASKISFDITAHFSRVTRHPQKRVLYLIWRKPWMAAGRNTFIHSMLETIGLSNATDKTRYPELTVEEMQKLNPDVILLSSEPFPFREKHIDELQRLIPNAKILLVDGEMFSWYGSRLRLAVDYFNGLEL